MRWGTVLKGTGLASTFSGFRGVVILLGTCAASHGCRSVGRGRCAPRRQSLLRSQARCALLPAATPRCVVRLSVIYRGMPLVAPRETYALECTAGRQDHLPCAAGPSCGGPQAPPTRR